MNVKKVHEIDTNKAKVSRSRNKVIFLNQEKMSMMNEQVHLLSCYVRKLIFYLEYLFFENMLLESCVMELYSEVNKVVS